MKLIIILLGLVFSFSLYAEEVLYCSSDIATGFIKSNENWKTIEFNNKRFVVKVNENFNSVEIDDFKYICNPSMVTDKFISCEDEYHIGFSFRYSTETNRFTKIYNSIHGHMSWNNGKDTDVMFGCKCEKF